jgi:hypothetical protein
MFLLMHLLAVKKRRRKELTGITIKEKVFQGVPRA